MALSSKRRRQGARPLSFYPAQGGICIRERDNRQTSEAIDLIRSKNTNSDTDRPLTFQWGVSEALGARRPGGEHVRPHVGGRDRRSSIPRRQLGLGLEDRSRWEAEGKTKEEEEEVSFMVSQ